MINEMGLNELSNQSDISLHNMRFGLIGSPEGSVLFWEFKPWVVIHRFTKHHISVLGSSFFFVLFFQSFFFKPNDSIPYCAYIWACSRGIPLIFGVVLPNFVYFYCFGGWKTNQCRQKNIVFVAFLWSVSL